MQMSKTVNNDVSMNPPKLAWPQSDMTYMCSLIGFNGVRDADCFGFLGSNMGGLARSWRSTKQRQAITLAQCAEAYGSSPNAGALTDQNNNTKLSRPSKPHGLFTLIQRIVNPKLEKRPITYTTLAASLQRKRWNSVDSALLSLMSSSRSWIVSVNCWKENGCVLQ